MKGVHTDGGATDRARPSDQALASQAQGLGPSGFDPSRNKAEVIDGIAYVVPKHEPFASGVRKIGDLALFLYCRWDAWGVGFQFLRAGFGIQIGPCLFGFCHIERQLAAFDAAIATEAGTAETGNTGSVHEGAGLKGIAQTPSGDSNG